MRSYSNLLIFSFFFLYLFVVHVLSPFLTVLPYTVEEFTADIQNSYKQAVADTAAVVISKVMYVMYTLM